ncbi:TetR/AcrR family transcriptional regulator [Sphingorhabdus sp. IMCC26285]|uniref:TetR/AcrR family transcriptional regulator n=1 Tax=Sphingorhabdus profundilacus TaxID=2509718 RepID=A0A6I4M496_9SPHN|nr:TetR/AcrR family transcriptional regulator [Sphingorhabdus profundilacus]MVZ97145.1 TetR/AcrR family transcriptional regulator [Sphingorhabdus profundilacus]
MARPQTDIEAGRAELLTVVDDLVRKRGAVDISMTDLAAAAGMSPSNLYRFFENKEALLEAVAERFFEDKSKIMVEVTESDLPVRNKMYEFFARRFLVMVQKYEAEPDLLKSYLEIGQQHFEVVRGYVDLGDHYLSLIVAEAMEQGYFQGLSIDETVSLINQMIHCYTNPESIIYIGTGKLRVEKLAHIVDAMFNGLGVQASAELTKESHIKIVS